MENGVYVESILQKTPEFFGTLELSQPPYFAYWAWCYFARVPFPPRRILLDIDHEEDAHEEDHRTISTIRMRIMKKMRMDLRIMNDKE